MIFSNNAVYCPQATAIDASGISQAKFSANYIEGKLSGAAIDGFGFFDGGVIAAAFVSPEKNDYWPGAGSSLIGNADPDFAPQLDFNCTGRKAPFDVGAYESQGHSKNARWRVQAGFKNCSRHTDD